MNMVPKMLEKSSRVVQNGGQGMGILKAVSSECS